MVGKRYCTGLTHPAAVAGTANLDDHGRITIDRALRPHLGGRLVQILTPRGVLLRPVADTLLGKDRLPSALRASGEQAAADEAGR
jgi:hypothetical protein